VSIYNKMDWKNLEQKMKNILEERKEEGIIIGGNFNIRIEELGNLNEWYREEIQGQNDREWRKELFRLSSKKRMVYNE